MARVIVMGGIGSGKSTVSSLLGEHGYLVVESDRIGHEVLKPGGPAYDAVVERWPEVVHEGQIDRGELGAIVFSDLAQLRQLEALTHPHIRHAILERSASSHDVAVELPLMPEFLGPDWVSVFVDAAEDVRRGRLEERGMAKQQIDARMGAQPSRAQWLEAADHVLDNNGTETQLREAVQSLVVTLAS